MTFCSATARTSNNMCSFSHPKYCIKKYIVKNKKWKEKRWIHNFLRQLKTTKKTSLLVFLTFFLSFWLSADFSHFPNTCHNNRKNVHFSIGFFLYMQKDINILYGQSLTNTHTHAIYYDDIQFLFYRTSLIQCSCSFRKKYHCYNMIFFCVLGLERRKMKMMPKDNDGWSWK